MDSYALRFSADGGVLRAEVHGERSPSQTEMALDMQACWDRVLRECQSRGLSQVLLVSHLTGWLSSAAVFCIVEHLALAVPRELQAIAIVDTRPESRAQQCFAAQLAARRGLPVGAFDDEGAARGWLAPAPAGAPAPVAAAHAPADVAHARGPGLARPPHPEPELLSTF